MGKSNRSFLLRNMGTYIALQVTNLLVGLVLPRLFLEVYGSEVNGVISTINSFIRYFSFLEAGLGLTLIHVMFDPLAKNDFKKLSSILTFGKKQYEKISIIYFALVIFLSIFLPYTKDTYNIGHYEFMVLVFVIGLFGTIDFYTMAKYRILLTADRKEYIICSIMILSQLLRFLIVYVLLHMSISVVWVKLAPIITLALRTLILKLYVMKKYPLVKFNERDSVPVNIVNDRWDALLLQISIHTSTALPVIIISQILSFEEANVYAVYALVINAVISIISALSSGVAPILGRSIAMGKNIGSSYDLYEFVVSIIIAIVFSSTSILILPFVEIYTSVTSDINYIYPIYAILFSLWGALFVYRIPLTAIVNAAGLYRENRVNNILNLILQIVLLTLSTFFFGIEGLLVSLIVVTLQRNVFFSIINDRALLNNRANKSIFRQAIVLICIISSYLFIGQYVNENSWNAFLWVKYGFFIFIIECLLCSFTFAILDLNTFRSIVLRIIGKH